MSATLPQRSLRYTHNSLGLSKNTVVINQDLDRPNMFPCAIAIYRTLDIQADLTMIVLEMNQDSEITIMPGVVLAMVPDHRFGSESESKLNCHEIHIPGQQ